jgi:hypothetical protein
MPGLDYKRMFTEAKTELESLHVQRANLDESLATVLAEIDVATKIYNTVAPIVGEPTIPSVKDTLLPALSTEALKTAGISVAVRSILDYSPKDNFTAATVRDALASKGWDWDKYKNPLATVHTVLVRLVEQSKVKEATTPEGKKCFYSANRAAVAPHAVVGAPDLSKFLALVAPETAAAALGKAAMFGRPDSQCAYRSKRNKKMMRRSAA